MTSISLRLVGEPMNFPGELQTGDEEFIACKFEIVDSVWTWFERLIGLVDVNLLDNLKDKNKPTTFY